ncbi:conserved protein of unknown function [Georgfuchsia toluolica]|uniref:6-hydroxymethylpterin diphosphokinase MptE-like domain-containing protein n=1 Tax=Georgfuchsia toluolica TaxID=424218 RepID=A0A916J6J6_9PROT|nr:6-hydroxymethylpterin diphosphokinase MptE-like protein [Georgfuchsia toluolica]CAG4884368.1 conserved protein of unknown function [Georgfuchsia toluolica]
METRVKNLAKQALHAMGNTYLEEPFSVLASSSSALRRFHNAHRGERCFIIGNGPSINQMDFGLLENEYTFAVNGIFYKTKENGFRPFYYVVEDYHVVRDNAPSIRDYEPRQGGAKFLPARFRHQFLRSQGDTYFLNMNRGFYEPRSAYYETPRFSVDAAHNVYCGQSVTIVNLQLAYYMGFSEVYLIGMDFSYQIPTTAIKEGDVIESTEDDVNHFHPDYFGKGKKWHDPKLHNVLKSYQLCKLMFELDDRKVFNATLGGKLEVFPRADFSSLFARE